MKKFSIFIVGLCLLLSGCNISKNSNTKSPTKVNSTSSIQSNSVSEEKSAQAGNKEDNLIISIGGNDINLRNNFEDTMLKKLNSKELAILRNSIYAKYGYKFKAKEYADYFSKISWYKAQLDDVNNLLDETDKQNIKNIIHYEGLLSDKELKIKYSKNDTDYGQGGKASIKFNGNNKEQILYVTKEDIKSTSESSNKPVRIKLKINNCEAQFESLWNDGVHVSVADFDKSDKDVDIYITEAGTDIHCTTYIYKFDGKKIYEYGSFTQFGGNFCYDENGKIYYWLYGGYKEDINDKFEFNHFYDYKTKQAGKITDSNLKMKLNNLFKPN